jgi:hypothetical protein
MSARGGMPGGGDTQFAAALWALKSGRSPGQSAEPGPKPFARLGQFGDQGGSPEDLPADPRKLAQPSDGQVRARGKEKPQSEASAGDTPENGRPEVGGSVRDAPTAIGESLDETIRQTGEWLIEKGAVLLAHAVIPGAGHLVVLFFEGKELLEDTAAWAGADGPVELHIPLVHLSPGLELEVGVELTAKDGDEDVRDGPGLILFAVPGDGGVVGGWGLERKEDITNKKKDHWAAFENVAVIDIDLSVVLDETDQSEQRMAILRRAAARLQSDLWTWPEYDDVSLIIVDDEQAGLGMWLARSETTAGMGEIVIFKEAQTGGLVARIMTPEDCG